MNFVRMRSELPFCRTLSGELLFRTRCRRCLAKVSNDSGTLAGELFSPLRHAACAIQSARYLMEVKRGWPKSIGSICQSPMSYEIFSSITPCIVMHAAYGGPH